MSTRSPSVSLFMLAAITSLASIAPAQSFFEGFEPGPVTPGVAPVPTGWTSVNVSVGGPGTNPNWQVRNDGAVFPAFGGASYAFANYNSATGANDISNYLISPLVVFNNGDVISFYTRTVPTPAFPDRLELVYNTTGSTNPVDFTNVLLTVNPGLTTVGYPSTWTQYTATISGLSGPTGGRFAFHYNPTNGGPFGNNSDYIGIDDVDYQATGGGTLATNATTGQGCYNRFNSFYELFAAGGNDLSGTSWTLTQNGTGGYDVVPGGPAFSAPSATATQVVGLTDDSQVAVGTLGLSVGSNGWVALGAGNANNYVPDAAVMLSNPASAVYFWHDMNPAASVGQIYYEESGPIAIVTYDALQDFGGAGVNSIRVEMVVAAPGSAPLIYLSFGALSAAGNGWLVGYSEGGPSANPGPTDISTAALISTTNPEVTAMQLTATSRPITGTTWDLATNNGALLDMIIVGVVDPNIADLSLIGLGLPGCGLRASLDAISVGPTLSLPIPNLAAYLGVSLFANGASLAPGVNAFGAITSNGIHGTIGDV